MIVHVDTSALVDALTGPRGSLDALITLTEQGHRLTLSTIVLYEWLRGTRTPRRAGRAGGTVPKRGGRRVRRRGSRAGVKALQTAAASPRARNRPRGGRLRPRRRRRDLDAQPQRLPRHPRPASRLRRRVRSCAASSGDPGGLPAVPEGSRRAPRRQSGHSVATDETDGIQRTDAIHGP